MESFFGAGEVTGFDRVGECVEQPGALVRRSLRPRPFERHAGGVDGAIDVDHVRHRRAGERLPARGLDELANLAGGRLRELAGDEEPVLALGGDRHRGNPNEARVSSVLDPG